MSNQKGLILTSMVVLLSVAAWWISSDKPTKPAPEQIARQVSPVISLPSKRAQESQKVARELKLPAPLVNPNYDRTVTLLKKTLLTKKEREEKILSLGSMEVIKKAFKQLGADEEIKDEQISARMQALDILGEAMLWEQNPNRAKIFSKVSAWLEVSVGASELDRSSQKILAGEAMELFAYLQRADADRAQIVFESVDDKQRRLFRYARRKLQRNQSRKEGKS